jgi:hypothetical protein
MINLNIILIISYPFWNDIFFYLFIVSSILTIFTTVLLRNINRHTLNLQHQHIAKIDLLRKDQSEKIEKIRHEVSQREEERNKQWSESEREMLYVLSGVSNLLDISEKIGRIESDKILAKLDEINLKLIEKTID